MSKHFCCCIPVRFGVFVLSLLSLLGAGSTAGLLFYTLARANDYNVSLDGNVRIAVIVGAVLYLVFALFALAGLIGAIIRSRPLVRTFSFLLWVQLALSLLQGIGFAVASFNATVRNKIIDQCVQSTTDAQNSINYPSGTINPGKLTQTEIQNSCQNIFKSGRVGFIVSFVIFFLITLYCCIIVHRYGNQLSEEQAYKASTHPMHPTQSAYHSRPGSSSYYPHVPLQQQEQGHAGYEYPYAKPEHSFGINKPAAL